MADLRTTPGDKSKGFEHSMAAESRLQTPSQTGFFSLDLAGTITATDSRFSSCLHYSAGELLGLPLVELFAPSMDPEKGMQAVRQQQSQGEGQDLLLSFTTKDGSTRVLRCHRHEKEDDSGLVIECDLSCAAIHTPQTSIPRTGVAVVSLSQLAEISRLELLQTRRSGRPLSLFSIAISLSGRPDELPPELTLSFLDIFTAICRTLDYSLAYLAGQNNLQIALLPSVGARGVLRITERLRTAFATWDTARTVDGQKRCRISIGSVTSRTGRTTYSALRSRADAKRDDVAPGRGRANI